MHVNADLQYSWVLSLDKPRHPIGNICSPKLGTCILVQRLLRYYFDTGQRQRISRKGANQRREYPGRETPKEVSTIKWFEYFE